MSQNNKAVDGLVDQPTRHFQDSAGAQLCTISRPKEHNSDFYQRPIYPISPRPPFLAFSQRSRLDCPGDARHES